jgi:hypothetical protein
VLFNPIGHYLQYLCYYPHMIDALREFSDTALKEVPKSLNELKDGFRIGGELIWDMAMAPVRYIQQISTLTRMTWISTEAAALLLAGISAAVGDPDASNACLVIGSIIPPVYLFSSLAYSLGSGGPQQFRPQPRQL